MFEFLVPVLVISALILLNALFVAAEFAIIAAPRARIERLALGGNRLAALVHSVQADQRRQDTYVATAQVGISAASVGLGMYGEHVLADWIGAVLAGSGWLHEAATHAVAAPIAVLLLSYLHVVLGEMVPKSLALFHPVKTAVGVGYPMLWCYWMLFPAVFILNSLGNLMLAVLRIPTAPESAHVHSPQELEIIVEESQQTGVIGEEESEIIVNLLHFSDLLVRKVMVPRTRVVGIDQNDPMSEILRTAIETRHTRYPVCSDGLDHIVGTLHVKELLKELRTHPGDPQLSRAMREAVFVPEQMSVEKLLAEFRAHRSQMAVVIDEYGGTAGMVSLEDVLEEIFGEVQDEFDQEEPAVQIVDDRHAVVEGLVRIDEFEEQFGVDLERPDVDTIGGLVLAELGRLARLGDEVEWSGVRFTVTRLDGLAVGRVDVLLPEALDLPEEGEQ